MKTVFYVAIAYLGAETIFQPTIVEKFEYLSDASSYAALMCRTKKRDYIVLQAIEEWDGTPQAND